MDLTGKQKRVLRGLAHHIRPGVLVGSDRVTPGLVAQVDRELSNHELLKIRVTDSDRDELREACDALVAATGAALVQTVGHTFVLFRRNAASPRVPVLPGEVLRTPSEAERKAEHERRRGTAKRSR